MTGSTSLSSKLLTALLVLLTLMLCTSLALAATSDGFTYTVSGGSATVTDYSGSDANVVVPSTLGGYPVTAIGSLAFNGVSTMQTIVIPEGVTSLANQSIANNDLLTSITLPSTLRTVSSRALYGNPKLKSIAIPEGVTALGSYCLAYNSAMTSVSLPSTLTTISDHCFYQSTALTTLNLPNDITSVGSYFIERDVTTLVCYEDSTTAATLYNAGWEATYVTQTSSSKRFTYRPLLSGDCVLVSDSQASGDYTLPDEIDGMTVVAVAEEAFLNNTAITSLTLPESVTVLGYSSFQGCTALTAVTLPAGITALGDSAFSGCTALATVNGLTEAPLDYLGDACFYKTALTSVVLPQTLTEVGSDCFANCTQLLSCILPDQLTAISDYMFYGCRKLTGVEIPASVKSIGRSAFYENVAMTAITLPDGLTSLGGWAFYSCYDLAEINHVPAGVTYMDEAVFAYCYDLDDVYFDGVRTMHYYALYKYSGTNVHLEGDSLTSADLRERGSNVRIYCHPNTQTAQTLLDEGIIAYTQRSLRSYAGGRVQMVAYLLNDGTYSIESVTSEQTNIHSGLSALTNDLNVSILEPAAFDACDALTSLNLRDLSAFRNLTTFSRSTFSGADSLTQVVLPDSVTTVIYPSSTIEDLSCVEGTTTAATLSDAGVPYTVYATLSDDGFVYQATEDGAGCVIIGYNGAETALTIPDALGGYPVTNVLSLAPAQQQFTGVVFPDTIATLSGSELFKNNTSLVSVTLPARLEAITGSNVFYGCTALTGVELPQTLTTLGSGVFWNCSKLTSITLPDSLTKLPPYCFSGCTALQTLVLPASLPEGFFDTAIYCFARCPFTSFELPANLKQVPPSMFSSCSSLTSITIPQGVTDVGDYAFYGCSKLSNVELPGTLTDIGTSAFEFCSALQGIVIPEGVTTLGANVFYDCTNLVSVDLPDTLTTIGWSAFDCCSSLQTLSIPEGVTALPASCFYGCPALTSVELPDSLQTIGDSAFAFSGLRSLTVPPQVTSIGTSAFDHCLSLTEMTLPESLTELNGSAFSGTSNLTLTLPANLTSITDPLNNLPALNLIRCLENSATSALLTEMGIAHETFPAEFSIDENGVLTAYNGVDALVTLPDDVTAIGPRAFRGNTTLTGVVIPAGVTQIGSYAFEGCTALTSVTGMAGVTTLGDYAFQGCTALPSITLPPQLTHIGVNAFFECAKLRTVTGLEGVVSVGDGAFSTCAALESLAFSPALTAIGSQAFTDCTALRAVTGLEGLTSLGANAFTRCSALASLTLPETITALDGSQFLGDTSLVLELPGSITAITGESYLSDVLLIRCPAETSTDALLTELGVAHEVYYPGFVISAGGELTAYTGSETHVTVPSVVNAIGVGAFRDHQTLVSVTIPDSVTAVHAYAFQNCPALESVRLPAGLGVLNDYAFARCSALTTVENLGNLAGVGSFAFYGCTALESVALNGEVLTSIAESAFQGCLSLRSVTGLESLTTLSVNAFKGCAALEEITLPQGLFSFDGTSFTGCTALTLSLPGDISGLTSPEALAGLQLIRCPAGSVTDALLTELGVAHETWIEGLTLSNGVVTAYTGDLTALVLPEGITGISRTAFSGSTTLESIVIPQSVTRLGNYTFQNCSALREVILPATLTGIGKSCFSHCVALEEIVIPQGMTVLENDTFFGCDLLSRVSLPEGLVSIETNAFLYCNSLTELTLPSTLTSIGQLAFPSNLKRLVVPDGLTSLGTNNFSYGMQYVVNPLSVSARTVSAAYALEIASGRYATPFTSSLQPELQMLWTQDAEPRLALVNCSGAQESLVIPDYVTQLGYEGYGASTGSTVLVLPDGITHAAEPLSSRLQCRPGTTTEATLRAAGLPYATPDDPLWYYRYDSQADGSVQTVLTATLATATDLVVPDGVQVLADGALSPCGSLYERVTLPDSLTTIEAGALSGLNSHTLEALVLGPNVSQTALLTQYVPADSLYAPAQSTTALSLNSAFRMIEHSDWKVQYLTHGGAELLCALDYLGTQTSLTLPEIITGLESHLFLSAVQNGFAGTVTLHDNVAYCADYAVITSQAILCRLHTPTAYAVSQAYLNKGLSYGVRPPDAPDVEVLQLPDLDGSARVAFIRYSGSDSAWAMPEDVTQLGLEDDTVSVYNCQVSLGSRISAIYASSLNWICSCPQDSVTERTLIANGLSYRLAEHLDFPLTGEITAEDTVRRTVTGYTGAATELVLPESFHALGAGAFANQALTSVTLPQTITELPDSAFSGCQALAGVTLPQSLTTLGTNAFASCTALTEIDLPDTVTAIGASAFHTCSALVRVGMPAQLQSIGSNAFAFCTALTEIDLPDTVTAIGNGAFNNSSVTALTLPDTVTSFGTTVMSYGGVIYATPDSQTTLAVSASGQVVTDPADPRFQYTMELAADGVTRELVLHKYTGAEAAHLVIPEGVSIIDSHAVNNHQEIRQVTFPETLHTVRTQAFTTCSYLDELYLPQSLTTVESLAFYYTAAYDVYLGDHITAVAADSFSQYATYYCGTQTDTARALFSAGLKIVPNDSPDTTLAGRVDENGQVTYILVRHYTSDETWTVPAYVSELADGSLASCSGKTIVIGENVTRAGSLLLPQNKIVPERVMLHDNLTDLAQDAFSNNDALLICSMDSATAHALSDAGRAFTPADQTHLSLRYLSADDGTQPLLLDRLACGATADVPDGIHTLGSGFLQGSAPVNIVLPQSLRVIEAGAFADCTLHALTIPDGVTELPSGMATGCESLRSLVLGKNLTAIAEDAFPQLSAVIYCYRNTPAAAWAEARGNYVIYLDGENLLDYTLITAPGSLKLLQGDAADLSGTVSAAPLPPEGEYTLVASSADPAVAVCDGLSVTGVGGGETIVTVSLAEHPEIYAEIPTTVLAPVSSFTLPGSVWLTGGESQQIRLTDILPAAYANQAFTWTLGGKLLADGPASAVISADSAPGIRTLTVTAQGGASRTCKVVTYETVSSVRIRSLPTGRLLPGDVFIPAYTLSVDGIPHTDADALVTLTSSDESVLLVQADGSVVAVGPGTATLTATVPGGATGKASVTIARPVTLTLPAALRVVEAEAFAGVTADVVILPEGCTTIGSAAFSGCSLMRAIIPASVTSISDDAFEGSTPSIWTTAGSYAAQYANEHGFPLVLTD